MVVSLKTGSTSSLINAFTMKPSSSSSYYSTIISLRLNSDWKSWTVDCLATRQSASLLWLKSSSKINQPGGEEVPLIPSIPSSHPKGSQHTPRKRQTTGKLPSKENKSILRGENKNQGRQPGKTSSSLPTLETWRIFGISVHPDDQEAMDWNKKNNVEEESSKSMSMTSLYDSIYERYISPSVLRSLYKRLGIPSSSSSSSISTLLHHVRVVRRSLDARRKNRKGIPPTYTYVIDIDVTPAVARQLRLRHIEGRIELLFTGIQDPFDKVSTVSATTTNHTSSNVSSSNKKQVVIVGAGPAGLFCALTLAQSGLVKPILVERGQPVEQRGKDIGALMHRRYLSTESNFAYGEGGAGTWSDGKLTTRIGRNSGAVRTVLETLVRYGAPPQILVEGAPHLGTDNLVRLLRNLRRDLIHRWGAQVHFGTSMTALQVHPDDPQTIEGVHVTRTIPKEGTKKDTDEKDDHSQDALAGENAESVVAEKQFLPGDAIVLATGHSARDVYETLYQAGIPLEPKGFAVGFRVEHPQHVINKIQYGTEWGPSVITGKAKTDATNQDYFDQLRLANRNQEDIGKHSGQLPVPSYRLATDKAHDGLGRTRGVYSFCMCPGGQIVPSSTDPNEICVNGMSFSKRDSLWANSALVVTVAPDDEILNDYRNEYGVLAGLAFQRDMERKAAQLGGGNLTVPVQRLTDFVQGVVSTTIPQSSYRLGVRSAPCHEIYPTPLTSALKDAIVNYFDKQMPGFYTNQGLLHGVETRTSSPLRISRDRETFVAMGTSNLFPAGEGAGFAGGIVSAAVDGMAVAEAVLDKLFGESREGKVQENLKSVGFDY